MEAAEPIRKYGKKCSYCCAVLWTSYFPPVGLWWADLNLALPGESEQQCSPLHCRSDPFCPWTLWFVLWKPKHDAPSATSTALLKTSPNLLGSLPQEVGPEMPPWRATGKSNVVYGMLLEEITCIQNTYVKVISAFTVQCFLVFKKS